MHAIVLERYGGPEVLTRAECADPQPGDGEVLVELRAAALNWHDCLVRQGRYPYALPRIIGSDGAGVRRDTGEEVIIAPSLNWGDDERVPGPEHELLGDLRDGTYAELVAIPEQNLRPKPAGWTFAEAAALPLAGLTAHRALFARGQVRAGETVLVLGAGGGVAGIGIALARMAGARVLVTTSSAANLEHARELGAEAGVLYTDAAWPERVRELAGPAGIDVAFDSVGSTWNDALGALRPGGRLVCFGATAGASCEVDVRRFYFSQQTILGTTLGSPADLSALLRLLDADRDWRPTIDRVLPLDRAGEAHALMEARAHTGKIVLAM
ncbi:MAG: oxidoreductase [Solirubrobacterales bacterium]|nr:oxidoreductase [Solirubrobacterales bacterium]